MKIEMSAKIEKSALDPNACYCLAPGVSIRTERFGGLVYRYDNRRLYFLHSHELVDFVTQLDGKVPLADALDNFLASSQLAPSARTTFTKALQQLEKLGTLVEVSVPGTLSLRHSEVEKRL